MSNVGDVLSLWHTHTLLLRIEFVQRSAVFACQLVIGSQSPQCSLLFWCVHYWVLVILSVRCNVSLSNVDCNEQSHVQKKRGKGIGKGKGNADRRSSSFQQTLHELRGQSRQGGRVRRAHSICLGTLWWFQFNFAAVVVVLLLLVMMAIRPAKRCLCAHTLVRAQQPAGSTISIFFSLSHSFSFGWSVVEAPSAA